MPTWVWSSPQIAGLVGSKTYCVCTNNMVYSPGLVALAGGCLMSIEAHGARKYRNSNLLLSSEGRGWRAITAELRQHSACEIPPITPASTELTIAIRGHHGGFVRRKGAGLRQETRAASGSIWITPIAVTDNQIQLTAAIPEVLHLYLSEQGLNTLTDGYDLPQVGTLGVRYLAGIQDDISGISAWRYW